MKQSPTYSPGDIVQKSYETVPMRLVTFLGFEGNKERWQVELASAVTYPCGQSLYDPKLPTIPDGRPTGDLFQDQSEDFALITETAVSTEFRHGADKRKAQESAFAKANPSLF